MARALLITLGVNDLKPQELVDQIKTMVSLEFDLLFHCSVH